MELEISVEQLRDVLAGENPPVLIDVREPWEVATASIAAAKPFPLGEIPTRAHQEFSEEQPILVICHHGARSLSVANWLRQQGYSQAQSISGGIDAWSRLIDPNVPRY